MGYTPKKILSRKGREDKKQNHHQFNQIPPLSLDNFAIDRKTSQSNEEEG